jgi:hypothetical protein
MGIIDGEHRRQLAKLNAWPIGKSSWQVVAR